MIPIPSPTSLDVYFAAHILLMADPPFPDTILQTQVIESFPGLVAHARRVQAEVARAPPYEIFKAPGSLLSSLVPHSFRGASQTQVNPEDIQFRRRSLIFALTALAAVTVYCAAFVLSLNISVEDAEDDEGEDSAEGESVLGDESRTLTDEEED